MADDDWYRSSAWGRKDRERFEAKLARAKREHRADYLRIKGLALTESSRRSRQDAGVELLERSLRDHPDAWQPTRASSHSHLADHFARRGDLPRAVEHLRQTITLDVGTNVDHGARERLGALLAEHPELVDDPGEAAALLDVDESSLVFRSQQFTWAVAQARLAAQAGDADRAAALARGAQWLAEHDEPTARRHARVGLIGSPGRAVATELERLARGGDAEAASPRVDEFRRPDGTVEWHWSLTRALAAPSADAGDHDVTLAGGARPSNDPAVDDAVHEGESRALLAELRAAGFDEAFELNEWTSMKLGSAAEVKLAAPILVRWLRDGRSYQTRIAAAHGLKDTRARKFAADQVVASFAALRDPYLGVVPPPDQATAQLRREKNALGDVLKTLARDAQFDALAEIVRDPTHGRARIWAWSALGYVKDPRLVDLAMEGLDDEEMWDGALGALGNARSERAEPVLRRLAALPKPKFVPGRSWEDEPPEEAELRVKISLAEDGLTKLAKARAAGKLRR